jgi:hypothetical protein
MSRRPPASRQIRDLGSVGSAPVFSSISFSATSDFVISCTTGSKIRIGNAASWVANTMLKIGSLFWQNGRDALSAPCA